MSDLREKLDKLSRVHGLMTGAEWKARTREDEDDREAGAFEIDRTVPGEVIGDEDSAFYLVRNVFPLDTPHGDLRLGEALKAQARHIAFSAADEELGDFDPRTAVFVDTETTGLMGGTGTVTFLVGAGYFEEDNFVLDQCFMRDYDEEEPMLNYLRGVFAKAETMVSYNGKSFDLPLLRTRFISNRVPFHLDSLSHFDLVHAARRFWKKRLGDCSLGNIEQKILGIHRTGDVPGHEIPRRYLDYLYSRDARPLEAVFYHHQMDILSLVSLTAHLSRAIDQPDATGFEHHEDRLSLLRVHFKQKQYAEVLALAPKLLAELDDELLRRECLGCAGFAAKRQQDWETAEEYFAQSAAEDPRGLEARFELAKLYEHRKRDLAAAERVCVEALESIEASGPQYSANPYLPDFRHRLERIRRKLGQFGAL